MYLHSFIEEVAQEKCILLSAAARTWPNNRSVGGCQVSPFHEKHVMYMGVAIIYISFTIFYIIQPIKQLLKVI